jgi:hypothetical protein
MTKNDFKPSPFIAKKAGMEVALKALRQIGIAQGHDVDKKEFNEEEVGGTID